MIFNSFEFIIFFVVFLFLYFGVLKDRTHRIILCLIGSYLFYGWWDWRFLSLILFSTVVDYSIGRSIFRSDSPGKKKNLVFLSLLANLGLLAIFKYFNFFIDSFQNITTLMGFSFSVYTLNIILPVGISFYTFQTLSYTLDIYRGKLKPENNFLIYSTYVAFFPQLVAGPIVRAGDLLPQFQKEHTFDSRRFISGMGLILLGFFKKVAVADTVAIIVDRGFENPELFPTINIIIFVLLYAVQIYGDFSGYSDIAIGIARILGYDFPVNFRFPYFARDFSDFWKRWHISLSSWLRDYLYISLGGNRKGKFNTQRNLMLTMLLGGLWHGASWTFVFWGFLHGLYLVLQRVLAPVNDFLAKIMFKKLHIFFNIVLTFSLVCLAWIFFRAQTFGDAFYIIGKILSFEEMGLSYIRYKFDIIRVLPPVFALFAGELFHQKYPVDELILQKPVFRYIAFSAIIWMILLFGSFSHNQFIYFQF